MHQNRTEEARKELDEALQITVSWRRKTRKPIGLM